MVSLALDMFQQSLEEKVGKGYLNNYKIPFVITGFEPEDIMLGILKLVEMIEEGKPYLLNAYPRSVKEEGNPHALEAINKVFKVSGSIWRGLGYIEIAGLN